MLPSSYPAGEELRDEGDPLEGLDPFIDDFSPDEKLSPLERLDKYFQSEDLGERYMFNDSTEVHNPRRDYCSVVARY